MKHRAICVLALTIALLNSQLPAEVIISINAPAGPDYGWVVIYSGQGYRAGWTNEDSYDAVGLWADLGSAGAAGQTGRAYLTTQIGPATSTANEIASTAFTFPLEVTNVALFQGLRLPSGAYYLSIIGDSPSWGSQWKSGAWTNDVITGQGVSSLGGFGAAGGMVSPYFPASPVYADSIVPPNFTVRGVNLSHPELQIALSGDSVLVSWSTNALGFVPESVDTLSSTNWQSITQVPTTNSGSFVITAKANGTQFFRLRKQNH